GAGAYPMLESSPQLQPQLRLKFSGTSTRTLPSSGRIESIPNEYCCACVGSSFQFDVSSTQLSLTTWLASDSVPQRLPSRASATPEGSDCAVGIWYSEILPEVVI